MNRARLLSFPPKVAKHAPGFAPLVQQTPFHFHYRATGDLFQGQSSSCSNTQLTLPWNCQWIRPQCTTVTMHLRAPHLQTESELQPPLTACLSPSMLYLRLLLYPGVPPSWASCCRRQVVTTGRPLFQGAQLTGWGWWQAQPAEAVH